MCFPYPFSLTGGNIFQRPGRKAFRQQFQKVVCSQGRRKIHQYYYRLQEPGQRIRQPVVRRILIQVLVQIEPYLNTMQGYTLPQTARKEFVSLHQKDPDL